METCRAFGVGQRVSSGVVPPTRQANSSYGHHPVIPRWQLLGTRVPVG